MTFLALMMAWSAWTFLIKSQYEYMLFLSYSNKPSLTNRTLKRSSTLIFYVLAKSVESWTTSNVLTAVYENAACLDLWTLLDHSFVVTHNLLFRPNFRSTYRWAPSLWSIFVISCIRLKLLLLWVHYTVEAVLVNTFYLLFDKNIASSSTVNASYKNVKS